MKIKKYRFFKRFFAVLFSFVILFSFFSVSASEWITTGDNIIGDFEIAYVGFAVDGVNTDATFSGERQLDGIRLRLQAIADSNLSTSKTYKVRVMFKCNNPAFYNSSSNVSLNWMIWAYNDRITYQPSTRAWRSSVLNSVPSGDYQLASNLFNGSGSQNRAYFDYSVNSIGHSYQYYYFEFDVKSLVSTTTQLSFYFTLPVVNIKTSGEMASEEIIDNANKNHNELVNGWDGSHDVDGTTVNDYGEAESELNSATSSAQSDSISFINNFGNLFGSSHVHNGLLAVSAIIKELFAINWVSDILTFALGLGCFAFILGTSYLIISRASSNERYKQSRESRRYTKKGGGG